MQKCLRLSSTVRRKSIRSVILLLVVSISLNIPIALLCSLVDRASKGPWTDIKTPDSYKKENGLVFAVRRSLGTVRVVSTRSSEGGVGDVSTSIQDSFVASLLLDVPIHEVASSKISVPSWSRVSGNGDHRLSQGSSGSLIEVGHGWPMISMSCSFGVSQTGGIILAPRSLALQLGSANIGNIPPGGRVVRRLSVDQWSEPRVLPLVPVFYGLIINTIFYSIIIFMFLFGVQYVRKLIRRLSGRCPMCTYDLQNNIASGCPECGWNRSAQPSTGDK